MARVYDEMIDFIARGSTPDEVAEWHASDAVCERVAFLIEEEKAGRLPPEQVAELDRFLELEHIVRLAKAKARQYRGT